MADRSERIRSLAFEYAAFLGIAYLFTWSLVIVGVKLGWNEDLLSITAAGPALAALILSRTVTSHSRDASKRPAWFFCFIPLCWIALSLRTSWWSSNHELPVHLKAVQMIPAVAPAWILSAFMSADARVRGIGQRLLHRPNRWSLYAILFFPVMLGIPTLIAYLLGAKLVWPGLGGIDAISGTTALMAFFSNVLYAGLLEEPGWRGFLLDRLQLRFSPLWASLLVWLPWAIWHGPIDYYRPVRFTIVQEILLRVVTLIPLTIILTWFYNRSGRSIQVAVLFHAAMNTFPYVLAYYPQAWFTIFAFTAFAIIQDRMWLRLGMLHGRASSNMERVTTGGNVRPAAPSGR